MIRERLVGQITVLKNESLDNTDSINLEEDGTAVFDRQFALDLVSSERDSLFEVDEALRRIEDGGYGICEKCEKLIEKQRLKAIPFVRMCIKCQSVIEKGDAGCVSRSARKLL